MTTPSISSLSTPGDDPRDRDPAELTTGELLISAHRPLHETGDADRATRARRLAHTYLERRQRRLRDQLHHRG